MMRRLHLPLSFVVGLGCGIVAAAALASAAAERRIDGFPDFRIALPRGMDFAGIYLSDINAEAAAPLGVRGPAVRIDGVRCGELQSGDVITGINGNRVFSLTDLLRRANQVDDTEPLDLTLMRSGYQLLARVRRPLPHKSIALLPGVSQVLIPVTPESDQSDAIQSGVGQVNPGQVLSVMRGVQLDNLSANIIQQLGLSPVTSGVFVSAVAADTPAAVAGLRPNDVIVDVNSSAVFSMAELFKIIGPGIDPVMLRINRHGAFLIVAIPAP